MHKLYVFTDPSGEGEFVIISDEPEPEVIREYSDEDENLSCYKVLEIDGNADAFPCDRPLRAR